MVQQKYFWEWQFIFCESIAKALFLVVNKSVMVSGGFVAILLEPVIKCAKEPGCCCFNSHIYQRRAEGEWEPRVVPLKVLLQRIFKLPIKNIYILGAEYQLKDSIGSLI